MATPARRSTSEMATIERATAAGGGAAEAGGDPGITILDRKLLAERDYWIAKLARHREAAELRLDYPRGARDPGRGGTFGFALDDGPYRSLTRLTGGGPFLLYTTLMAALKACVYRYTGGGTVSIGSPARRREDGTQAPNLVALVDALDGRMTFRQLLLAVRQTLLDAYSRQQYPFERLVQDLAATGVESRCPFFDLILASSELHTPWPAVANDLTIRCEPALASLRGSIIFRADLFAAPTIARFAAHFLRLLAAAVADPETPLADLSLLSAAERCQLLAEWNDTAGPFPRALAMQQLFEARAEAEPAAPAVRCAAATLGYGELERRANRLAHLLRELGAGPGTLVGFWVEGSVEMVVGLLAILKAGAAYVPVEGGWPRERIAKIFAALGVRLLLTGARELRAVYELRPQLARVICIDVEEPAPPPEPVEAQAVRALWDHVAESATDRVTAAGFRSSYSGDPFTEAEVDQYRDRVLELAAPLAGAQARVLELGCGSCLIGYALAPLVGSYVGLDPSPATQAKNRGAASAGLHSNVELVTGFAHQLDGFTAGTFDLVVLASTVQFFPGPMYLKQVIGEALRLLVPGGALLITDVMDARQKEAFRRSLEERRGERRGAAGRGRTEPGDELYLDEEFFRDLQDDFADLAHVAASYRGSEFDNELRYRFDVVLRKADCQSPRSSRRGGGWLLTGAHAAGFPATRPAAGAGPGDLAYIIHTSGSTGVPKGVMVRHEAAVQLIDWVNREFAVGPADRVLLVSSLCFDLSVYDVFGLLAAGGAVEVPAPADARDPARLAALLGEGRITFWDSAPATLQQLMPHLPPRPVEGMDALRLVFLSGDWIPLALPGQARKAFPAARVVSLGGATEAAIWSNFFPVGEIDPLWTSIPYGRPISNARYYVLDPGLRPCPIGIAGDLFIGGLCLACGYANDAAASAEKFVPDPYGGDAGARLYRTGDRARVTADGNMEFLGRLDQQVKIRGFRVELAEVEAALGQHPAVREVVAVAREEAPNLKALVAYVVPRQGMRPTTGELQRFVRERLPDYMVPSAFTLLDTIPLTPHGKVDRAGLLAREGPRPGLESSFVPPRTQVEQLLARIWAEVLKCDRVGIEDNFFELGGHSLKGTQVASRVREAFGIELPLRLLFKSPTIGELARVIEDRKGSVAAGGDAPPIVPLARAPRLPAQTAPPDPWQASAEETP